MFLSFFLSDVSFGTTYFWPDLCDSCNDIKQSHKQSTGGERQKNEEGCRVKTVSQVIIVSCDDFYKHVERVNIQKLFNPGF